MGGFFQPLEEEREFCHDAEVGGGVGGLGEEQAEGEDEFVAGVGGGGEADGVGEDAVGAVEEGEGEGAEILARDDDGGDGGEVDQRGSGRGGGGGDGADGNLVEDFGACRGRSERGEEGRGTWGLPSWTSNLLKKIAFIMTSRVCPVGSPTSA